MSTMLGELEAGSCKFVTVSSAIGKVCACLDSQPHWVPFAAWAG